MKHVCKQIAIVKQGVDPWVDWIRKKLNICPKCAAPIIGE